MIERWYGFIFLIDEEEEDEILPWPWPAAEDDGLNQA